MNYVVVLYFCVVICYVLQINENFIGDLKLLHSTVLYVCLLFFTVIKLENSTGKIVALQGNKSVSPLPAFSFARPPARPP